MKLRLAVVSFGLLLSGCARLPVLEDDRLGFIGRQDELEAIAAWDMLGGIAIDDGERAYQARFDWWQRDDELELFVRNRLPGTPRLRVTGNRQSLRVESRGDTEVLTDPEIQLSEMLGWWLPVTSAEHWLLGRPDPDFPSQSTAGEFDTLRTLNQRDWSISYEEYQLAEGRLIPRRMILTWAPLELTIRILDWESVTAEP